MRYKGIIALKDAYCDPSSLQSDGKFSLVINKGVLLWEVLTSKYLRNKFKDAFKDTFIDNWKCDIYPKIYLSLWYFHSSLYKEMLQLMIKDEVIFSNRWKKRKCLMLCQPIHFGSHWYTWVVRGSTAVFVRGSCNTKNRKSISGLQCWCCGGLPQMRKCIGNPVKPGKNISCICL